jgi:2-keto-3-deoxy-L-rhamnonate aldolase RhmA
MRPTDIRVTPIVRVPANSSEWISRVLDGGAQAVIVPHVNTRLEAESVVKCAKFAPIGQRSATNGMPLLRYNTVAYKEANLVANDLTTVICMIETEEALQNVE